MGGLAKLYSENVARNRVLWAWGENGSEVFLATNYARGRA